MNTATYAKQMDALRAEFRAGLDDAPAATVLDQAERLFRTACKTGFVSDDVHDRFVDLVAAARTLADLRDAAKPAAVAAAMFAYDTII